MIHILYINKECIENIGIKWENIITKIEDAVRCLDAGDYAQPVKPYLRYRDIKNRIIAMPAFVGGDFDVAGIKWIASFPDNILKDIPRAHSTVVLNNSKTGQPVALINTALLSIIRTASVTGTIIKFYDRAKHLDSFKVGIIGWGPIGQYHYKMLSELYSDRITDFYLYDLKKIDINNIAINGRQKVHIVDSWEEAYFNSNIFITCTVSKEPYIDKEPSKGILLLNVSLRDFKSDIYDYVKNSIIVDDWEEVCRENTDIENMSKYKGLRREDIKTISDVICRNCMSAMVNDTIMFNPMGMAIFDIAVAKYYLDEAIKMHLGQELT